MKDNHVRTFIQEANELLLSLESSLIELETDPGNLELVGEIFRSLHTIKGGGGMFGFDEVASFVHDIETIFDKIRDEELEVTNDIIDLTLKACDQIKLMLQDDDSSDKVSVGKLLSSFKEILGKETVEEITPANYQSHLPSGEKLIFHIRFEPGENLFAHGTNPVGLLNELKELGNVLIIPDTGKLPSFDNLDPEKLYVSWDIILSTSKGINAVKDVFIFVDDDNVKINQIDKGELKGDYDYYLPLITGKEVNRNTNPDKTNVHSSGKGKQVNESEKKTANNNTNSIEREVSNIRVSSDKLDLLVNLVGELVTTQARVSQLASTMKDSVLINLSEDLERLTCELRDNALSIRMLPIGTTFTKFKRLVRDLSKDLNKNVELVTSGGETELDKNVIEKLNDPLVHIIRNSIDHGIETPGERIAKGKEKTGKIFLEAIHSGTHVYIKIKDDGKGLDKELLRLKAIEREIISPDTELTEKEIYNLIFNAGFSTAKSVTNVSGRGVGMDVVKNAIAALRGSVEVDSQPGDGTIITLKLPLTLAIIEGLIVRIDQDHFVIPLSSVHECIEFISGNEKKSGRRNLLNVRGEIVPYISLRERFDIYNNEPLIQQAVVLQDNGTKTGFIVDEIIGEHQTVIKSLGKYYKNVENMSGATILGDGTVALILDVPKLIASEVINENYLINK